MRSSKKIKLLIFLSLLLSANIVSNKSFAQVNSGDIKNSYEVYGVYVSTSATVYVKYNDYIDNPVDKMWQTKYKSKITYGGYVYFIKIINDNGRKYALYRGTLYGYAAPPLRRVMEEIKE